MSDAVEAHRRSLMAFAARVPELLRRHGATAPLAREVESLDLAGQLERRFTLVVLGRMRAGKSTLVNAMIGENLAAVGVNVTTATVNWFEHGQDTKHFRVRWRRDGAPEETRPLGELHEFIGHGDTPRATAYLRFQAPAPLLEGKLVVDLPGTGSVDDSHEERVREFAAGSRPEFYGGEPHAVLFVLPPTVKETDKDFLDLFARSSRSRAHGAYNSVAVVQKWEALEADDPAAEAQAMATRFYRSLEGKVAEVLPVSGVLGLFAANVPPEILERLALLATIPPEPAFRRMVLSRNGFTAAIPDLPFDPEERRRLATAVRWHLTGGRPEDMDPWEILAFVLNEARRRNCSDAAALKQRLHHLSGLDRLQEILERRFFRISALIQAGSVLQKAQEPCERGALLLRNRLDGLRDLSARGEALLKALTRAGDRRTGLDGDLVTYVRDSLEPIRAEAAALSATLRDLESLAAQARGEFALLLGDIDCLVILDETERQIDPDLLRILRTLFGVAGVDPHQRLGLAFDTPSEEVLAQADALQVTLRRFARSEPSQKLRRLAIHAEDRVASLFEALRPS